MSEVKVNKISPRSGTGVQLGDSGDTITIPSGATINNQGTAVNFGATGSASWVTDSIKTATFTATAGEGYFCNTTAGAFTVNLPAGSAGAVVAVKDYANTFDSNSLTIAANGSDKIGGLTDDVTMSTEGIAITLVFIDSTQGWLVTDSGLQSEAPQTYTADFLVIAGGGSGGGGWGAGGGAGGFRTSTQNLEVGTSITVTVGDGGAAQTSRVKGNNGADSSISGSGLTTITSTGGGAGNAGNVEEGVANSGGSGGGGSGDAVTNTAGSGNTPSTTPSQGNDGGAGVSGAAYYPCGGGGGAGGVGTAGSNSVSPYNGPGGVGTASSITSASVTYAGGGGAGAYTGPAGSGGSGGGGNGGTTGAGTAGTANTGGGGGGGGWNAAPRNSGAGGKGVVILSVPDANYSGTTTGSPTVSTNAGGTGKTVLTFTGTGSYTA